jgi:alkylation response protein AidB-like acyl-CoA dehydrogenase
LSDLALPAEIRDRLAEVRAVITANAGRASADRRIPDESLAALRDAGLLKIAVPKRHGGYQGNMATMLAAGAAIGEADGSTGWVTALTQICSWMVGLFGAAAQDDVFGANPDAIVCGSLNPAGATAEPTDGGWHLSGRWTYVSGSLHAQWAILGFTAPGDDATPAAPHLAIVPMSELTVQDTWHMAGMRGTGSNTVLSREVFVPTHRVMSMISAIRGQYPTEFTDEISYRMAFLPVTTLVLVGPLLGTARAALEYVRSAAVKKGIVATNYTSQASSPGFQIKVAQAAMRIDSAQLHASRAADDIDRHAERGTSPDYDTTARIRMDSAIAAEYVTQAVSMLLDSHGSGGFAEASPLQRIWQDANVGARHALLNSSVAYAIYGKSLLAVENDVTPFG